MNDIISHLEERASRSFEALLAWHLRCKTSHLSSSLSCLDILNFLLRFRMNLREDVLVLSKGHAASILYVIMAEEGLIEQNNLLSYSSENSKIPGHVPWSLPRPVLCASGSLGYGTGVASGWAWAEKVTRKENAARAYCIISDGELNTGVFWESLLSISHLNVSNLEVFVDANGLQAYGATEEVLSLGSLRTKFESFGFEVFQIDGHDYAQFLELPMEKALKPRIVVCHTKKGNRLTLNSQGYEIHYQSL